MSAIAVYILISTCCLSVFYVIYRSLLLNDTDFRSQRLYLILAVFISLLIPFNTYTVSLPFDLDFNVMPEMESADMQMLATEESVVAPGYSPANAPVQPGSSRTINWFAWIFYTYGSVAMVLVIKAIMEIVVLALFYNKSTKEKREHLRIIFNDRYHSSFSFFNWIFINKKELSVQEVDDIVAHENVHASQYHSFDLVLMELLSAVMWFNPLIRMMKSSVQQVHEYLADEGALNNGIDQLKYQALLVNQVAEGKIICLSSNFNHSLIKKRIAMMTKRKFHQRTILKNLVIIPAGIMLFFAISCVNTQRTGSKTFAAVEPVKMNVLYIGVDNPLRIAAPGYEQKHIRVEIDNGEIIGESGNYIAKVEQRGIATVTVYAKDKLIQETEFRVQTIGAAVGVIAGITRGKIDKATMLNTEFVEAKFEDFDFELNVHVTSFTMVALVGRDLVTERSATNQITPRMKNIITGLKSKSKVFIEEIMVKAADGQERQASTMSLIVI